MKDGSVRIQSIFGPTIQGEGPLAGVPCAFIRTGGCDYRCAWCDTPYAVDSKHRDQWTPLTPDSVVAALYDCTYGVEWIVLSGGNPAAQECGALVNALHYAGYKVQVETQGSVWRHWLNSADMVVVSPKPPSAQIKFDDAAFEGFMALTQRAHIKVVVFNDADFDFAEWIVDHYNQPVHLSVGNPDPHGDANRLMLLDRYKWLIDKALRSQLSSSFIVQPQLHVLAYGNKADV